MSDAVIARNVADELAWKIVRCYRSSRLSCLSVQSLLYSLVAEKMYQKVPSGTSSSTGATFAERKCAQIGSIFVDSIDRSPMMKRKISYRNYFRGKMTKNEYDLKRDSLSSIGGRVWLDGYHQAILTQKVAATADAYLRILRQFTGWIAERPGHGKHFEPTQLTTTVVELYLSSLKEQGYSVSHRTRVKSVINQFCQWLIEEKEVLRRTLPVG